MSCLGAGWMGRVQTEARRLEEAMQSPGPREGEVGERAAVPREGRIPGKMLATGGLATGASSTALLQPLKGLALAIQDPRRPSCTSVFQGMANWGASNPLGAPPRPQGQLGAEASIPLYRPGPYQHHQMFS